MMEKTEEIEGLEAEFAQETTEREEYDVRKSWETFDFEITETCVHMGDRTRGGGFGGWGGGRAAGAAAPAC